MKPRPPLSKSLAAAIHYRVEKRGWPGFLPYVLAVCTGLGAWAAWSIPGSFWNDDQWSVSATVYGGVLAFNAILLAVSGNSFAKIYEIITGPPIGPILRKHGLLEEHLGFADLTQLILVAAAIASLAGLITVLLPADLWVDRALLAGSFSLSAYSLARTLQTARMMHELIWEQAHVGEDESRQSHLRPVENGR
jgi:hypothetical protein